MIPTLFCDLQQPTDRGHSPLMKSRQFTPVHGCLKTLVGLPVIAIFQTVERSSRAGNTAPYVESGSTDRTWRVRFQTTDPHSWQCHWQIAKMVGPRRSLCWNGFFSVRKRRGKGAASRSLPWSMSRRPWDRLGTPNQTMRHQIRSHPANPFSLTASTLRLRENTQYSSHVLPIQGQGTGRRGRDFANVRAVQNPRARCLLGVGWRGTGFWLNSSSEEIT